MKQSSNICGSVFLSLKHQFNFVVRQTFLTEILCSLDGFVDVATQVVYSRTVYAYISCIEDTVK